MLQLTCYGGVGQIGGNQFLLEDGHSRLFFDFGTPFGARGRFYEEYLKPRSAFGLLAPLTMGLLPPLEGLYRPDMEPPASALWDELRGEADPEFLSIHCVPLDPSLWVVDRFDAFLEERRRLIASVVRSVLGIHLGEREDREAPGALR